MDFLSKEEGKRCFILTSDTDKKDQKNLCGKLKEVEYCPKQDDHKVINHETPENKTDRNLPITNHKP